MKAYQVVEFGKDLVCNAVQDPTPGSTEVVVDVVACGLCHSDVHFHEGHLSLGGDAKLPVSAVGMHLPTALGHEIFGRISAFGSDAGLGPKDIGQPVVVYPWIGCGECAACRAERDNECATPKSIGLQLSGGHGEKVVVRESKYLMPAHGLDENYAGLFACSGLTAYSALNKLSRRDGYIGIIGAGGLGLMALSIEKGLRPETQVVVFDIDTSKLNVAQNEYGAERVVDSRDAAAVEKTKAETGGFIGVVDFVGSQQTVDLGLDLLRNGGTYVNVGLFGASLQLPLPLLAARQLSILGSFTGAPAELRELIEHARAGRIRPIPTTVAPIADLNESLAELRSGKVTGRIVHRHAS